MNHQIIERDNLIVKSNSLIQKTRYNLSLQEQKIILYLISKIKPTDDEFETYTFNLKDLCDVCGITYHSKNYQNFKDALKTLHDNSFWVKTENGETLCTWVNKVWIDEKKLAVEIRLDEDLRPYLLQLRENFTVYELGYILVMKSKYSVRLYELLKSYSNLVEIQLSVAELKERLQTPEYSDYKNFRVRVIDPAVSEINEQTDIHVEYEQHKTGRAITHLTFRISEKTSAEQVMLRVRRNAALDAK